ncbi:MAG: tetratricopeptide repeat protein [Ilumatobacteraceae bacterium]
MVQRAGHIRGKVVATFRGWRREELAMRGLLDGHGNPITGDADAVALYDRAIDRLVRFHPDVLDLAGELAGAADPVPMASVLVAYLNLMSTDVADVAAAAEAHAALAGCEANDRERAHAAAIGAWLAGDWGGAAGRLDDLLVQWPTDVLALMLGHQLDFFTGEAASLRDRPLRALRALDPQHPHAPFVRGMTAFGLEEAGDYGAALDAGRAAVAANPDDVWAVHAVVHTYEMQGRVDEGIAFLRSDETRWESGNLFTVHNWWHLALYELEAGRPERALAIYDAEVHHAASLGVPIEMLDASALLWRLRLDDADTGGRFAPLADAWAAKGAATPWYVFNDLHAVMAGAGAGRLDQAGAIVDRLGAWLPEATGSNAAMTAEIGLPACRAVVAFAEDRHDDVVAELLPIRRVLHHFGGSHAQRDALQRTLLESALRGGHLRLARALTAERLGVRETSVYGWTQWARVLRGLGDEHGAAEADVNAAAHRRRFAAVVD